jgi:hypothetical protein
MSEQSIPTEPVPARHETVIEAPPGAASGYVSAARGLLFALVFGLLLSAALGALLAVPRSHSSAALPAPSPFPPILDVLAAAGAPKPE